MGARADGQPKSTYTPGYLPLEVAKLLLQQWKESEFLKAKFYSAAFSVVETSSAHHDCNIACECSVPSKLVTTSFRIKEIPAQAMSKPKRKLVGKKPV